METGLKEIGVLIAIETGQRAGFESALCRTLLRDGFLLAAVAANPGTVRDSLGNDYHTTDKATDLLEAIAELPGKMRWVVV